MGCSLNRTCCVSKHTGKKIPKKERQPCKEKCTMSVHICWLVIFQQHQQIATCEKKDTLALSQQHESHIHLVFKSVCLIWQTWIEKCTPKSVFYYGTRPLPVLFPPLFAGMHMVQKVQWLKFTVLWIRIRGEEGKMGMTHPFVLVSHYKVTVCGSTLDWTTLHVFLQSFGLHETWGSSKAATI